MIFSFVVVASKNFCKSNKLVSVLIQKNSHVQKLVGQKQKRFRDRNIQHFLRLDTQPRFRLHGSFHRHRICICRIRLQNAVQLPTFVRIHVLVQNRLDDWLPDAERFVIIKHLKVENCLNTQFRFPILYVRIQGTFNQDHRFRVHLLDVRLDGDREAFRREYRLSNK